MEMSLDCLKIKTHKRNTKGAHKHAKMADGWMNNEIIQMSCRLKMNSDVISNLVPNLFFL